MKFSQCGSQVMGIIRRKKDYYLKFIHVPFSLMQQLAFSCLIAYTFIRKNVVIKKPPATFPITGVHYRRSSGLAIVLYDQGPDEKKG